MQVIKEIWLLFEKHFKIVFLLSNFSILYLTFRAFSFTQKTSIKKKVILMDEVDGMSSGDRGGIQELVRYIIVLL